MITVALSLTGVVFLVLSGMFALGSCDRYGRVVSIRLSIAAWTSLGLAATMFLISIWHHALVGG